MTDNKTIKSEQWYARELNCRINLGEISKPKFQRKKKWDIIHIKDTRANEQDYIKFLYDTQHSVHAITFGQINNNNKISFSNIDGNNRINAIKHFIDTPFDIFPEYLNDLFKLFNSLKSVDSNIISQIKTIFNTISYNDIIKIKTPQKYFKQINQEELYSNIISINLSVDEEVEKIQYNLRINGTLDFDTNVKINVNLFHGYNTDELCKIFEDINKFNGTLSELELLACRLFNENNFTITNAKFKSQILTQLTDIYNNRSKGEVLQCFTYNETLNSMNAYDFIISFQDILSEKYNFIEKTSTEGLSLLFKIYKGLYTLHDSFTTKNINDFIDKLSYSCNVFNKIIIKIFTDTINVTLFTGKCRDKLKTLKTNNIYMLISCIIGYYKQNINIKIIINSIEKCVLYHFMVADITNKDIREELQAFDTIGYKAGGHYIDNIVHKFLLTPTEISNKITKEQFSKLIKYLYDENSIVYERFLDEEQTKYKNEKRRSLKFYEKTLMFYYYKQKIPTNLLENNFSIEHICPNSSVWDGELNKDRPGNLIPIINSINCSRQNKHISYYLNADNQGFCNYIQDIIPTYEDYDLIIKHDKKPHIISNDKYNDMCSLNENIYLDNFITCLYD